MNTAKPYLITGMPLTPTAWLAAFLNTGKSICYHEPMGRINSLEDIAEVYESTYYKFIGIADSGLGFFLDTIIEMIDPKIVVLDMELHEFDQISDVLRVPRSNYGELLREELARFQRHPNVLWVPHNLIYDKRVAEKIFWHCMPGEPFDEVRFEEFSRYEIRPDPQKSARALFERNRVFQALMADILPRMKLRQVEMGAPARAALH